MLTTPSNYHSNRHIYSVSRLTSELKALIEEKFPFIWLSGEISNYTKAASGHSYFSVKDEAAQISAVMFRGQTRNLRFDLEDGLAVVGLGRLSVYPPRGAYQIIFEYIEPKGIGSLQVAFEQLKKRLADEGLFDTSFKKPLPFLPNKISIITSPTGAVIHDMLRIAERRFPNLHFQVIPTKVQGDDAADEIADALSGLNRSEDSTDVVILARGGGSLEDLWAFNSEKVARAIYNLKIPIVAAVGHETDITIADFVADLRAPTPSAAIEMVLPDKQHLLDQVHQLTASLNRNMRSILDNGRTRLIDATQRLQHPAKRFQDTRLRVDELLFRLKAQTQKILKHARTELESNATRLHKHSPLQQTKLLHKYLEQNVQRLNRAVKAVSDANTSRLASLTGTLKALDPLAILARGYSITRTVPDAQIVRDQAAVQVGQELEVKLHKGHLKVAINQKGTPDAKTNL